MAEALHRTARAGVVPLLERVGLAADLVDRYPGQLSGGQRQRVAIARALAPRPSLIICDEPVSALDVSVQAQVLDLLAGIRATDGTALLFISHDLGVMHHVADRVLVMRNGAVVESGSVGEVFHRPRHAYTRALLDAVPSLQVAPRSSRCAPSAGRLLRSASMGCSRSGRATRWCSTSPTSDRSRPSECSGTWGLPGRAESMSRVLAPLTMGIKASSCISVLSSARQTFSAMADVRNIVARAGYCKRGIPARAV